MAKKEEKNLIFDEGDSKKKKRKRNLVLGGVFLLGFLIAIYPVISQLYYRQVATREVESFDTKRNELDEAELKERLELAHAYNRTLDPTRMADPFTEKEEAGRREYAKMLEIGEKIGHVEIPQINEDLPVYAGTGEDILQKGAGHLEGSSLPVGGKNTHAVVTAHRGLPTAKLFRELDKLRKGDVFLYHNIEGVLAYEVDQILTVEPTNFEPVLVQEGEDLMTLLTCTPYMINSHRLLVRGHRIPYKPEAEITRRATGTSDASYREYFMITLSIILFLVLVLFIEYSSLRKHKKIFRELRKKRDKNE